MNQTPLILAFSFLAPGFFVAGVVLASIPIIIHILNRRRFKEVPWAAMEFLLRAMKQNRRRLRFEQWLLLATRCLLLGLLGLALARPMGCNQSTLAGLAGKRTGLHVIILDNSYSMSYEADRPDAKTHLDQAKKLARGLIDRLSSGGESVALITASAPSSAPLPKPVYDLSAARGAVDRIEQSCTGTDLPGAMELALQLAREESRQPIKNLYLLTDSTRSAFAAPDAPRLEQLGKDLASIYRVHWFDLSKPQQWNAAVVDLRTSGNLVRSRFANELLADARVFGSGADPAISWKLDDQILPGGGVVKLSADPKPQQVSLSSTKEGGIHLITTTLAAQDRLPVDNTRHKVIDIAAELKVLVVEGERSAGALSGSAAFLQLALAPPTESQTPGAERSLSYVQPELISDLEIGNRILADYRAILLAGVGNLQPAQADQLAQYVKSGGTLLLFMGESVNADNYNAQLLPRGLLPGRLVKRVTAPADQSGYLLDFKPLGNLHPLLGIFRGEERSGLDTAQVFSYVQASIPADAKVERVLNYLPAPNSPADPAIIAHDLGAGRVVFISTGADAAWTTLPAKPAFVALIHELLAGSVRAADAWMNLTVGEAMQIPPTFRLTAMPRLLDPRQKEILLHQSADGAGATHYRSAELTDPGVYTLNTGGRNLPIAVNVPGEEADIRPMDRAAIQKALGGIEMELLNDQLPEIAEAANTGRDYGWSILIAVLMLAGFECMLAMRFGHYAK